MPDDPAEPENDTDTEAGADVDVGHESLAFPSDEILTAWVAARDEQDAKRGEWTGLRYVEDSWYLGVPMDDPTIAYLVRHFEKALESGWTLHTAAELLAHQAWMEGGIDGYDLGQAAARKELGDASL